MTDCDKDTNQQYMTKTNKGIQEKTITGLGWNNKNNKHGRGGGGITKFTGGGPGWMGVLGVLGPQDEGWK